MSKLALLVSTSKGIATFKVRYNRLEDEEIRPSEEGDIAQNKGFGRVLIPLTAFVKGGFR